MRTIRFNIGDAFPASDPVARFITVLAIMANDWLRLMSDMLELEDGDPDSTGRSIMLFRQQAALHHEAAEFIVDARKRFTEVDAFIRGLDQDARNESDQVTGGIDPKSSHYLGDWLADHRNVTFHYPEMHPDKAAHGQEEITEALNKAAGLEGTITGLERLRDLRFRFADEVAVQWLPDGATEGDLIVALRESVMALGSFVQRAATAYLQARPDGTITIEDSPDTTG